MIHIIDEFCGENDVDIDQLKLIISQIKNNISFSWKSFEKESSYKLSVSFFKNVYLAYENDFGETIESIQLTKCEALAQLREILFRYSFIDYLKSFIW